MASILVAEDDEAMREFLSQALKRQGHEVTAVSGGAEALHMLAKARYELLVADIRMPGVDGISLARCARRDHPAVPILFVTGYAGEIMAENDFRTDKVDVLPKPFRLAELVDTVSRMLAVWTPAA